LDNQVVPKLASRWLTAAARVRLDEVFSALT